MGKMFYQKLLGFLRQSERPDFGCVVQLLVFELLLNKRESNISGPLL